MLFAEASWGAMASWTLASAAGIGRPNGMAAPRLLLSAPRQSHSACKLRVEKAEKARSSRMLDQENVSSELDVDHIKALLDQNRFW